MSNYPEVFDLLDDPDLWQRIRVPTPPDTGRVQPVAQGVPSPPRQSFGKQLSTMVRRNAAVVVADRLLLTMLLALPVVLGALSRIVPGKDGLSLDRDPHGHARRAWCCSRPRRPSNASSC